MKRPQIGAPPPKRAQPTKTTVTRETQPKVSGAKATNGNVVSLRSRQARTTQGSARQDSARQDRARQLKPSNSVQRRPRSAKGVSVGKLFTRDRFTSALSRRLNRSVNQVVDARSRFKSYSRNRRMVGYSVMGSFAALILLVIACVLTPIIAVQKIEVTGLNRVSEKQVMAILKKQIGLPLPQVNQDAIAESLKQFALIDSVAAIARPPHTLQVAITERQAICIVNVGGVSYLYDPAGVRIDRARLSDKYPVISIVGDPQQSPTFSEAIDVLLALPSDLLSRIAEIDAKSKDDVTMRLRGYAGQKILWGDSTQAILKSKVLAALIKNQKQTDRVTFDVSSPTAPIVRYQ